MCKLILKLLIYRNLTKVQPIRKKSINIHKYNPKTPTNLKMVTLNLQPIKVSILKITLILIPPRFHNQSHSKIVCARAFKKKINSGEIQANKACISLIQIHSKNTLKI